MLEPVERFGVMLGVGRFLSGEDQALAQPRSLRAVASRLHERLG